MESIFHYTDAAGAVGIVQSQSLFASDSRYLNDFSEGTLLDPLLTPILREETAAATKELISEGLLREKYYEVIGQNADALEVEAMLRSIRQATNNISPTYVLSFCRHEEGSEQFNNGLLSQWRGYATGGGFAFEFVESDLDKLMEAESQRYFYGPTRWRHVLYEDFEALFKPEDYEGLARAMIGQVFLDPKITPILAFKERMKIKRIAGKKNIDKTIGEYLSIAPFFKSFGFHEEREYRVSVACVHKSRVPKEAKSPAKQVHYRVRRDLIVPYIKLFDDPDLTLPIKSIIVGPHPQQAMQQEAMERLLESSGISATVRSSDIPFRGL